MTFDAPLDALNAPSPIGLSAEEKLVWILGDMMNAVENYFCAENPKRLGHINSAAIRIIDEVLAPDRDRLAAAQALDNDALKRHVKALEQQVEDLEAESSNLAHRLSEIEEARLYPVKVTDALRIDEEAAP